MGYHIILNSTSENLESIFIDDFEALLDMGDIDEDVIVYESDAKWVPKRLKDYPQHKDYIGDFKAGKMAEKYFLESAESLKLFVEQIDQSPKALKKYIDETNSKTIKRPDFLIRKPQVDIEIKCYSKDKNGYFALRYSEYIGLENYSEKTQIPILLGIYEKKDSAPIRESLRLIPMSFIKKYSNDKNKKIDYDAEKKSYKIHESEISFSLDFIEKQKDNLQFVIE